MRRCQVATHIRIIRMLLPLVILAGFLDQLTTRNMSISSSVSSLQIKQQQQQQQQQDKTVSPNIVSVSDINGNSDSDSDSNIDSNNDMNKPTGPITQHIFHIHYHKTGHAVSYQYKRAVHQILKLMTEEEEEENNNEEQKQLVGGGGGGVRRITNKMMESMDVQAKNDLEPNFHIRRTHDNTTGCPTPLYNWVAESNHKINLILHATPNFLCNIYENDVLKQISNQDDVKFIHMIRDPIGTYNIV